MAIDPIVIVKNTQWTKQYCHGEKFKLVNLYIYKH